MNRYQKTSYELGALLELVIKAMFGIVIIYLVAKALIEIIVGPQGAKVISVILGLAILFAIVVSKRVRNEVLSFGGK